MAGYEHWPGSGASVNLSLPLTEIFNPDSCLKVT